MPDTRNWRDRVARAAAADVGRDADEKTISQARGLADRWLSGAVVGLCAFVVLGAFSGYATTAILLRPADGQVDAAAALLGIVALPWLCMAMRGIAMLLLKWRVSLLLDWLIPMWLLWGAGRSAGWDATSQDLARISHQVTAADADMTGFAALNAARVLDVLSSTPARPDSRSPCKSSHLRALARNLVRNAG